MLVQDGADPRTSGGFYVTVVLSVLLFGSETWVVTPHILRAVGSLHNRAAHWISGRMPQRLWNGGWDYPPIGKALTDAFLEMIGVYISLSQNTVAQYIATRVIFDITVAGLRGPGSLALLRWWGQAGIQFRDGGEAIWG